MQQVISQGEIISTLFVNFIREWFWSLSLIVYDHIKQWRGTGTAPSSSKASAIRMSSINDFIMWETWILRNK